MAEPAWPLNCAGSGCKAQVHEESAHFVWRCVLQGHTHATCSSECQRSFEKSCGKVADLLDKRRHELKQEKGNALQKAGQHEQEKLRQRERAERNGGLLCPTDAKADGRVAATQVPHCACCLDLVRGPAVPEAPVCPDLARSSACPAEAPAQVLLSGLEDFDMLREYKKGDDEAEEFGGGHKGQKKGGGAKKAKGRRVFLSAAEIRLMEQSEGPREVPTPTTPTDELDEPRQDEQAPSSSDGEVALLAEAVPGEEEEVCEPEPEEKGVEDAPPRLYASTRSWRPKPSPELEQCIAVRQGQILEVTWVDGQAHDGDAWAYGRIRGDLCHGYFPKDILGPVPQGCP